MGTRIKLARSPYLHEEIRAILEAHGNRWMTTREIAERVNQRGRYRKRDGSEISPFQVARRTYNYPDFFEVVGGRVRCKTE